MGLGHLFIVTATLHATFYASSAKYPTAKQANMIIPIATMANDTGAQASVPPQFNVCTRIQRLVVPALTVFSS
jgi:hypothetical protein